MVYSCNYNIELLTKYLSYKIDGIGTWNRSKEIIKNFLNDFYGENDVNVDDGSGLSVKNLVTTEFMSNFIRKINNTNPEFLRFLPAPGEGTLAKRFHNVKNFGIYAKTGTLFGTSFLSGISETNGISFSIGINNSISVENEREKLIDDILTYQFPILISFPIVPPATYLHSIYNPLVFYYHSLKSSGE